jgi:hypothetical protein
MTAARKASRAREQQAGMVEKVDFVVKAKRLSGKNAHRGAQLM